jgi:hypothetical protein
LEFGTKTVIDTNILFQKCLATFPRTTIKKNSSENYFKDWPIITLKKEVSSPQTKYIPLNVHCLINYRNVLCHIPLATHLIDYSKRDRERREERMGRKRKRGRQD